MLCLLPCAPTHDLCTPAALLPTQPNPAVAISFLLCLLAKCDVMHLQPRFWRFSSEKNKQQQCRFPATCASQQYGREARLAHRIDCSSQRGLGCIDAMEHRHAAKQRKIDNERDQGAASHLTLTRTRIDMAWRRGSLRCTGTQHVPRVTRFLPHRGAPNYYNKAHWHFDIWSSSALRHLSSSGCIAIRCRSLS